MRLYHGSNLTVKNPNPAFSKRSRMDFGRGFYTTTSEEQAVDFTHLIYERRQSQGLKTVNVYELDIDIFKKLKIMNHQGATEEGVDYVESNRRKRNGLKEDYDLVIGPVADDNIQQTFILYEQGVLSKSEALKRLRAEKLKDQFVFKTERSVEFLTFVDAWEVERHE